jgi:hypothetical protein
MNLFQVGHALGERLIGTFLKDKTGRRPVFGGAEKFQTDPHWRDNLLFYEYFHGDNGAGIGANHQTGWTGCVARIIEANGALKEEMLGERDVERMAIRQSAGAQCDDTTEVDEKKAVVAAVTKA